MSFPTVDDGRSYLQAVRDTCTQLDTDGLVQVNQDAIKAFVQDRNAGMIRKLGESLAAHITGFGIEFESLLQEVSFITFAHAMDFGSGFRQELHKFHRKGAFLTIKAGLINMYNLNHDLDSSFLAEITQDTVTECFLPDLNDCKEDSVTEALKVFISYLVGVSHEIGIGLRDQGYKHVYELVLDALKKGSSDNGAASVVKALVDSFPYTFKDAYYYPSESGPSTSKQAVFLYKKAQLSTGELYHSFRNQDERFNFKDAHLLTAYVDNVIVATMRKTGCITCRERLHNAIDTHVALPKGSKEEIALRAKSLEATELIAREFNKVDSSVDLKACEVGNYLWAVLGKEPEFRAYQRHATPDTLFY
ncbi:hypothetical protein SARC_05367 [Sphaeroforma arctica JP610]|uniref:Queuosine 5'-phosphate N-glycosylase/hydrolase n=1 Tax=Sphaeroforma arctica JP610 TaxID=667725 RepID=A0A0L0G0H0_9EUKA|nr:hypothetical protein SARC_05367 [Sphaeroforma arctica JP610]KNC82354.1 hypothetical protein SARC_05367 [Sphaeroforma arctica JP610]|eukprot:XP_014156256.1 hypothetical protein SARC_05367 [Sphaeroforma arctica JP610]